MNYKEIYDLRNNKNVSVNKYFKTRFMKFDKSLYLSSDIEPKLLGIQVKLASLIHRIAKTINPDSDVEMRNTRWILNSLAGRLTSNTVYIIWQNNTIDIVDINCHKTTNHFVIAVCRILTTLLNKTLEDIAANIYSIKDKLNYLVLPDDEFELMIRLI